MNSHVTSMPSPTPAVGLSTEPQRAGDIWSRSVGQVIAALAVVGLLFVGALLLLYFGTVNPHGRAEVAAPAMGKLRALPVVPTSPVADTPIVAAGPPSLETPARVDPLRRDAARSHAAPAALPKPAAEPPASAGRAASPPSVSTRRTVVEPERDVSASTSSPAVPDALVSAPAISGGAGDVPAPGAAPVAEVVPAPAIAAPVPRAPESEAAPKPPAVAEPRRDALEASTPVTLRPVARPQPQFPRLAQQQGVRRGRVVASIAVATDGRVSAVTIVSSDPPQLFDRAAQSALAQWRFEPIPRPTSVQVELAFRAE
ncbi:MAG: TonB family protein [Gemmatimonadota bacterium]